jgi:hypothetical protein
MLYHQEELASKARLMVQDDAGTGSFLVEAILQETFCEVKNG